MSTIKQDIIEYLSEEGLRPQDKEYGIHFKYHMLSLFIRWDEEDDHYLSIYLPSIFSSDENNRGDVLEVINRINLNHKVVKCLLVNDDVWVATEQLLDSTPVFGDIIERTLDMLVQARDQFYEDLRNLS